MSSTPPSTFEPGPLAERLRAARGTLTATDLAEQAGWQVSKISKIEHGRQLPKDEDLDVWARLTGATQAERHDWGLLLQAAEGARRDLTSQVRAGQRVLQRRFNEVIAQTRHFKLFEATMMPRYLQLPAYTRAVLAESFDRLGKGGDIEEGVAERQASVPHLFDKTRRFEFIITESVLGWRFSTLDRPTHRAQLEHLLAMQKMFSLPGAVGNVRFGIVPLFRPIKWAPRNSFYIMDDRGAAEHWIGDNQFLLTDQVDQLNAIFENLWESACEGEQAAEIIQRAIEQLDRASD